MNFKTKKEDLISLNISGILTIIVAIVNFHGKHYINGTFMLLCFVFIICDTLGLLDTKNDQK
ncbi:hypothetical protein [Clostridium botulinum]|uniref:hypothetical protein n=1 Tax=Clostridium botulinum TaxID=1491 RepID=UPI0004DA8389|nr:hypothetical protein [Clostridium botulinum]KEH96818.1 hypothetical protein Z953_13820 [Clostridium botulinum D str. 16868]